MKVLDLLVTSVGVHVGGGSMLSCHFASESNKAEHRSADLPAACRGSASRSLHLVQSYLEKAVSAPPY